MEFASFSVKAKTITLIIIPNEIPIPTCRDQPKLIMWVLASLIFDSI